MIHELGTSPTLYWSGLALRCFRLEGARSQRCSWSDLALRCFRLEGARSQRCSWSDLALQCDAMLCHCYMMFFELEIQSGYLGPKAALACF